MKFLHYLSIFLLCGSLSLLSQSSSNSEVGFWVGTSNYLGDLNLGSGFSSYQEIGPAGGFVFRYALDPHVALKTTASMGYIGFEDALSDNPFPEVRNLHFNSILVEVAQHVEFHFNRFISGDATWNSTPYLSLGLGLFYFNPKTTFGDQTFVLQELGTEGQQLGDLTGFEPYKLIQPSIPIAFGFKKWVRNKWNLSFEIGYRFTFTDYIDDVGGVYLDENIFGSSSLTADLADRSEEVADFPVGVSGKQRGDSVGKDAYIFSALTLTYSIFRIKCK